VPNEQPPVMALKHMTLDELVILYMMNIYSEAQQKESTIEFY
jgi:hypothetical protein